MHSRRDGSAQQDADKAQEATPSKTAAVSDSAGATAIPTMKDKDLTMEIDVQLMQLTLKASHPQNLPSSIAQSVDVLEIFGNVTMQACVVEETTKRKCYRLVGRSHDIQSWVEDPRIPPQDHFREYYPNELFPRRRAGSRAYLVPCRKRISCGRSPSRCTSTKMLFRTTRKWHT